MNDDLTQWVQARCTAVPAQSYQSGSSSTGAGGFSGFGGGGLQLYDCAAAAKQG